jgi:hypothetical protein
LDEVGIAELVRLAEGACTDEWDRGRALDTKTASSAAFSGLVLTIDTALARSVFDINLGSVGNVLARAGLLVASLALLVAITLAIGGVLMPQKYRALAWDQVDEFCGPTFQTKPRLEIQRGVLQSLSASLAQGRAINDCKARVIKMVARAVLLGFVCLTVAAVTLAVHNFHGRAVTHDRGSQAVEHKLGGKAK